MSTKFAILALVGAAAAIPRPFGGPLYPRGNDTVIPHPTGYVEPITTLATTLQVTGVTTVVNYLTLTRQVELAPTGAASNGNNANSGNNAVQDVTPEAAVSGGSDGAQCGGVVTSTIKEQVTVYVTADDSVPSEAAPIVSSAAPSFVFVSSSVAPAPVQSQPAYVPPVEAPATSEAPSAPVEAAPSTPAPVETSAAAPAPVEPSAAPSPSEGASNPSPPSSPSGGKRGVAYNDASLASAFSGAGKISWAMNWESDPKGLSGDLEYCPTMWGLKYPFTDIWTELADKALASGSTHLLGFNEPDHPDQANLSPAAAADAWKTYMQPYAGKAKLGSPSVTNGGGEMGLTYLKNFMNACSDCTIDFCQVHWYDSADNIEYFKNHMQQANEACGGRPIWLTEFGCTGSDEQVQTFVKEVMEWMDGQDYIERYAYFMVKQGSLTADNTLGSIYATS